jgi:hypothetical protein
MSGELTYCARCNCRRYRNAEDKCEVCASYQKAREARSTLGGGEACKAFKLDDNQRLSLHTLMHQWSRNTDLQFNQVVGWVEEVVQRELAGAQNAIEEGRG